VGKHIDMVLRCSMKYSDCRNAFSDKGHLMAPSQWQPPRSATTLQQPTLMTAIGRGLLGQCPNCGKSHIFNGFLRVVGECRACGAPLGLARADDAPPYFTILVTGHVIVPIMFMVDRSYELSTFAMSAIFLPMTLIMALGLLRPIKGGTVGLMLSLNMLKTDTDDR